MPRPLHKRETASYTKGYPLMAIVSHAGSPGRKDKSNKSLPKKSSTIGITSKSKQSADTPIISHPDIQRAHFSNIKASLK